MKAGDVVAPRSDHKTRELDSAGQAQTGVTSPAADKIRGDGNEQEFTSPMNMVSTSVYSTCTQGRPALGAAQLHGGRPL